MTDYSAVSVADLLWLARTGWYVQVSEAEPSAAGTDQMHVELCDCGWRDSFKVDTEALPHKAFVGEFRVAVHRAREWSAASGRTPEWRLSVDDEWNKEDA